MTYYEFHIVLCKVYYFVVSLVFHVCILQELSPSTSQWADLQKIKVDNPVLAPLVEDVKAIVRAGKSENTNKQYDLYFKKFTEWCSHYKFSALPADVCTVVLYISYLVQKNVSVSVLNSIFFSISWKHNYHLLKKKILEKKS